MKKNLLTTKWNTLIMALILILAMGGGFFIVAVQAHAEGEEVFTVKCNTFAKDKIYGVSDIESCTTLEKEYDIGDGTIKVRGGLMEN